VNVGKPKGDVAELKEERPGGGTRRITRRRDIEESRRRYPEELPGGETFDNYIYMWMS
jgi:hypothetical protein